MACKMHMVRWHSKPPAGTVTEFVAWQDMLREMKQELAEADIPAEYGGHNSSELYERPTEVQVREYLSSMSK